MAITIFALAGREPVAPELGAATLILIDYQNEYLAGPLALSGAETAVERAAALLAAARAVGTRIVHVAHRGAAGGLFDRTAHRGAIIDALAPRDGEPLIEKQLANGFVGTELAAHVPPGAPLLIAGFMTHNCVSSTARAAVDRGHAVTIAWDACATRELPAPDGTVVPAAELNRAVLAGLGDAQAGLASVATLTRATFSENANGA